MQAPSELDTLGLAGHLFRAAGASEWHGPCPWCGGNDRFAVHAVHPFPSWLWMCRVCSPEWKWLDELRPELKRQITPEERDRLNRERELIEQARAAELTKIMSRFTTAEIWLAANQTMTERQRQWWQGRGVPDDWQDYLQLGYTAHYYSYGGAYTIPYLRQSGAPATMQYRLENPPEPKDKYRFEKGLPAAWYDTDPIAELTDQVIICEGAIKAMVVKIKTETQSSVFGVPSKSTWAGIQQIVKDCGRVWIILDPDGEREAEKLARQIGKNARVVRLPDKVDDALMAGMTINEFRNYLKYARKIS